MQTNINNEIKNSTNSFLIETFNQHLNNSRLSMSQMAQKLEISKSHLSDIKNNKKQPSLNLGLKILKLCKVSSGERNLWVDDYNKSISSEYEQLQHMHKDNIYSENLHKDIADIFVSDMQLFNIYLDIINSNEDGISKAYLISNYGIASIESLAQLIDKDMIWIKDDLYYSTNKYVVFDKKNTFNFAQTLIRSQQRKYLHNNWNGKLHFTVNDVAPDAYSEITKLYGEFMKNVADICKDKEMSKADGGKRCVVQSMITKMCLAIVFTLIMNMAAVYALGGSGGGVTGGDDLAFFLNNDDYKVKFPVEKFDGYQIDSNQVCTVMDDSMFRTVKKYDVCQNKYGNSVEGIIKCRNVGPTHLYKSMYYQKKVCQDQNCYFSHYIEKKRPLVKKVKVYLKRSIEYAPSFEVVDYLIPECLDK